MYSPEIVCFCDIPTEDLEIHTSKYSRFGLSLTKDFVANQGGAPVLYLPKNTRVRDWQDISTEQIQGMSPEQIFEWAKGLTDESYIFLGQLFDRMLPKYHALTEAIVEQARVPLKQPEDPAAVMELVPQLHARHTEGRRLVEVLQFINSRLLSYVKFFDHSLSEDDPKNFYMEREWRVVGNVQFTIDDVKRVFIPAEYSNRLRADVPSFAGELTFV